MMWVTKCSKNSHEVKYRQRHFAPLEALETRQMLSSLGSAILNDSTLEGAGNNDYWLAKQIQNIQPISLANNYFQASGRMSNDYPSVPIVCYEFTVTSRISIEFTTSGAHVASAVVNDKNQNKWIDNNEELPHDYTPYMIDTFALTLDPGTYYYRVAIQLTTSYTTYSVDMICMPVDIAGSTIATARDLGILTSPLTITEWVGVTDPNDYYKYEINNTSYIDVKLYGSCEIVWDRNNNGRVDSGETWATKTEGGSIYKRASTGVYYIKVNYEHMRGRYTLNLKSAATNLITFSTWSQDGYIGNNISYNSFDPLDSITHLRSLVGCSPIAAAQIMDYWNFPSNLTLGSMDAYTSVASNGATVHIPADAATEQFPTFATINNALASINYTDPSDEAYLAFALGIVVQADFSSEGTSSYFGAADFRRLGFLSAQDSSNWDAVKPTVIANIQAGQPVMLDVDDSAHPDVAGHSFVVDGYDPVTGKFHCNFGWGGAYDGWYSPPTFNVNGANYNHISGITYNIAPPVSAPVNLMVSADSTPWHEQIYWDTTLLATGYQVWRSTSNNPATATNITPLNLTTTSYLDTSGRRYYYWIKAVNANGSSAFSSALAVVPNYTPLVTNLYRDALGRAPDTAGINHWTTQLDNGTITAAQIATGFTGSVEYRAKRINEVYRSILNRNPDQWGFNNWLNYLGNGHTLEQMKAGFYGSPEYRARKGGTNTTVVTAYYRDILGRAPDAEGLAHWMTLLNSGSTATQVAYAIMSSSYEGAGLIVRRCYTTYLHRDPDTAGYQSWVNRILHGTSEITIITGFLGSPEYARRG